MLFKNLKLKYIVVFIVLLCTRTVVQLPFINSILRLCYNVLIKLNICWFQGKEKEFEEALNKMLEQAKDKIKGIEQVKQEHRTKAESIASKIRELKTVIEKDSKDKLGYVDDLEKIAAKAKESGQFRMDTLGPSDQEPSNSKVTSSRRSYSSSSSSGGDGLGGDGTKVSSSKSSYSSSSSSGGDGLGGLEGLDLLGLGGNSALEGEVDGGEQSNKIKTMDNIESLSAVGSISPVLKIKSAAKIKSITVLINIGSVIPSDPPCKDTFCLSKYDYNIHVFLKTFFKIFSLQK